MFLPIGRECRLRLPEDAAKEEVIHVSGNRDRSYIALVSASSIFIFQNQPPVLICALRRSADEVEERGEFTRAYWHFDGAAIAVTTSHSTLLIYTVHYETDEPVLRWKEGGRFKGGSVGHRPSRVLLSEEGCPNVGLLPAVAVNLTAPVTCAVSLREELFICGQNGFSHHVNWHGGVDPDFSFSLAHLPFAVDQMQSKPAYLPPSSTVYVHDCAYAPLYGGFCLVLSDGRAALLASREDPHFHPSNLLCVWASQLRDAVCVEANHRFRLVMFGCSNGEVAAYHLDDFSGALLLTYRVSLRVRDGPELANRLGRVREMRLLPQGGAFAVVWDSSQQKKLPNGNGGSTATDTPDKVMPSSSSTSMAPLPPVLALFSPMGSQIWCSLESTVDGESDSTSPRSASDSYKSVDWGQEGYSLWLAGGPNNGGASRIELARCAALNNPYMEHSDRVVLLAGHRLMISPPREREEEAASPHSVWSTVEIRPEYLRCNWPIRFASLDREEGKIVVVAGQRGLSFCSISQQRWKIFGNESQERDLTVTGGVFVWRGMIGAAAESKIKLYPQETRLDERFASSRETDSKVIMINLKGDCLATLDALSRLLLYTLRRVDNAAERNSFPRAEIERAAEIRIGNLIPHIACLVSVHLTILNHDTSSPAMFASGVDTVLLNVSGRLITLNPRFAAKEESEGDEEESRFQLNQPLTIASFVEQVWHDRAVRAELDVEGDEQRKEDGHTGNEGRARKASQQSRGSYRQPPHLQNALWINCGARGLHVWLALFPGRRGAGGAAPPHDSFISKRIMLPFSLEIKPLLIYSSDCVACGVESAPSLFGSRFKLHTVHRNSEVFIHHLLRQLLKRNLGMFALDIAESFRSLPYFSHSLELLLHNVLEEEATSSDPIPDPLLPRVVAFIQEFPEFLRTVAHCARKTELALWPALFAVTGAPNDLFEVCLRDGNFETAAIYLIILQNIESAQTSLEQASLLLREALSACAWPLVRDLVRFARSIDADDLQLPTRSPPLQMGRRDGRLGSSSSKSTVAPNDELVFARFQAAGKINRMRHSHSITESAVAGTASGGAGSRKDSAGGGARKLVKNHSSEPSPPSPSSGGPTNPLNERLQLLLHEHAARLLDEYCVRDLGSLCAHLDMDTPGLLSSLSLLSSSSPAASSSSPSSPGLAKSPLRIADFPRALTRVHAQFEWPYPVASSRVVDQLAKRFASLRPSISSICLASHPNGGSSLASERKSSVTTVDSEVIGKGMNGMKGRVNGEGEEKARDVEREESIEEGTEMAEETIFMETIDRRDNATTATNEVAGGPRSASPGASSLQTSATPLDESRSLAGPYENGSPSLSLSSTEAGRGAEAVHEAQLRHMIGVFGEVAAIDWVFLLCVVLRDAGVARQALSVAAGKRAGPRAMHEARETCGVLIEWARQNCHGYVPVLQVFDAHLSVVCDAIGPAPQDPAIPGETRKAMAMVTGNPSKPTRKSTTGNGSAVPILPKARGLRESFTQPGSAVRGRRERSRSVDRLRAEEDVVSHHTAQDGRDCSIM